MRQLNFLENKMIESCFFKQNSWIFVVIDELQKVKFPIFKALSTDQNL